MDNEEILTEKQKQFLLDLARKAIKSVVFNEQFEFDTTFLKGKLLDNYATFVTLKNREDNSLRGCIGTILPIRPLYKDVISNAINSALFDPRFDKIRPEEFNKIKIEISLLTVPKKRSFKSEAELIEYLKKYKPGLIISKNGQQATFLPSVWEEIKNPTDFLEHLCLKAGLLKNCYKDPNLKIQTYEAIKFSEN